MDKSTSSEVWKYFKKISDKDLEQCSICPKTLTYKGSSTSNLMKHLDKVHKIKTSKTSTAINEPAPTTSSQENPIPNTKQCPKRPRTDIESFLRVPVKAAEVVARLIAQDGISIRAVTRSKFIREAFSQKQLHLPKSEAKVMELVYEQYEEEKSSVVQELQILLKSGQRFSLSLDEWTSLKNRRYLNLNVHVNDGRKYNLGLVFIPGKCGAEEVKSIVMKHLHEFGLSMQRHVLASTTDGAAVMQKFGRECPTEMVLCLNHAIHLAVIDVIYTKKNEADNEGPIDSDSEIQHYGEENDDFSSDSDENDDIEASEIIIQTDFKQALQDVRKIVRLFRKSPLSNSLLQKYVKEDKGRELQLLLDTRTRWNSLVTMVDRFLELKQSIKKALADINHDWKDENEPTLEHLVKMLRPLKVAVEALSRQDATILTSDAILSVLLRTIRQIDTPLSDKLYLALEKRVKERRDARLYTLCKFLHNPESLSSSSLETTSKTVMIKYAESLFDRLFAASGNEDTVGIHNSSDEEDNLSLRTLRDTTMAMAIANNSNDNISFEFELNEAINKATASISATNIDRSKLKKEFQVINFLIIISSFVFFYFRT